MRLRVFSDLHLETDAFAPAPVACDVVVLAGDVHTGTRAIPWARAAFPDVPVLYVPGNHEYYGRAMPTLVAELRAAAVGTNVTVLDDTCITLHGVTFLGTTLWTDFALGGDPSQAMAAAGVRMTDYRRIRAGPGSGKLTPAATRARHHAARAWLERTAAATPGPKVVVTHHAPSVQSLPDHWRGRDVSPAYASALDDLVAHIGADLWIHGHVHHPSDYTIGRTRVRCNPRGYGDERVVGFDPDGALDLTPDA